MKCEIKRGDDMSLDEYFSKMLALDNIEIDAGFLTAVRHPESDLTIPAIAAIQQFGNETNNTPARPFLTDGAVHASKEIPKHFDEVFRDYLLRGRGLAAFEPIAKVSRESIAKAIALQRYRPLSPVTIKIRRDKGNYSSHILIDTGYLINSIESEIKKGRSKK